MFFNIAYVTIVVRARLQGYDNTLEEAAHDLGANEWQTFWRITLPLIAPGIIGGALLAFTLSIDDFVITFFTAGVGYTTLSVHIYSLLKFGITPKINAISTMLLANSIVFIPIISCGSKGVLLPPKSKIFNYSLRVSGIDLSLESVDTGVAFHFVSGSVFS